MAIVIQTLEDERMVWYVPLLVLSEEVFYCPHANSVPKAEGSVVEILF